MAMQLKNDTYAQCPYEKAHRILVSRLQFHLVKCQKVHPTSKFVECKLNSTHKILEPELRCHMEYFCPDRHKLDTYIGQTEETAEPLFPVQIIEVESSESWDNTFCPTYDPMSSCVDKPILLQLQGATPSERKAFRYKERTRLQMCASQNKNKSQDNSKRLPKTTSLAESAVSSSVDFERPSTSAQADSSSSDSRSSSIEKPSSSSDCDVTTSEPGPSGFQMPSTSRQGARMGRGGRYKSDSEDFITPSRRNRGYARKH